MPVLFLRFEENDISGPYFLNWFAIPLNPTESLRDDDGLSHWVSVPPSSGARFKGDEAASGVPAAVSLKQRIYTHPAGEPIQRSNHGGSLADIGEFHSDLPEVENCRGNHRPHTLHNMR